MSQFKSTDSEIRGSRRRYILSAGTLIAISSIAIIACSRSQNSGNSGGGQAPTVQNPTGAPPSMDLKLDDLAPAGCLDLGLITEKFQNFPPDAVVREYTTSFTMDKQAIDGKPLDRYRDMLAESALAAVSFDEKTAVLYDADLPTVTQSGCDFVEITDKIGGKERWLIVPSDSKNMLHLKTPEGDHEKTYVLKSPRELEITSTAPRIDRCPDFQKAMGTTVRTRVWGAQADLNAIPIRVSADMLKEVSVAVTEMPVALNQLLAQASDSDMVQPNPSDLRSLKTLAQDPRVVRCGFDATPPPADEAPPAEETPTPTPTPAPAPPSVLPPGPDAGPHPH